MSSSAGSPAIEIAASPAGSSNGVEGPSTNPQPLLFYVNVPFPLGVHLIGSQLAVPTKDALGPVGLFRDDNQPCFLDLLKDYLSGLFGMAPESIFPLYSLSVRSGSGQDALAPYAFITLEAFLLLLFTKVPTNLSSMDNTLKKQTTDFIRKSLNVMTSFLQVKMPPNVAPGVASAAGSQANSPLLPLANESIRSYMAQFMAAAAAGSTADPPPLIRMQQGSSGAQGDVKPPMTSQMDADDTPTVTTVTSDSQPK